MELTYFIGQCRGGEGLRWCVVCIVIGCIVIAAASIDCHACLGLSFTCITKPDVFVPGPLLPHIWDGHLAATLCEDLAQRSA